MLSFSIEQPAVVGQYGTVGEVGIDARFQSKLKAAVADTKSTRSTRKSSSLKAVGSSGALVLPSTTPRMFACMRSL